MSNKIKISYLLTKENQDRLQLLELDNICFVEYPIADTVIVILDTHQCREEIEKILSDKNKKVFLITHLETEKIFLDFLCKYKIDHIIGEGSSVFAREISLHLGYELRNKVPSMDTILMDNGEHASVITRDSSEVDDVIDLLIRQVNIGPFFNSPLDYLKIFGNELLMNAFYSSEFNNQSRRKKVVLDDNIEVKLGVDDNFLVFSVKDPFGTLSRERLIESLTRSYREKTPENKSGGAGLGLYMVFMNANQVIVCINENVSSEIICIIDRSKRAKMFKSRITSFNFYRGE